MATEVTETGVSAAAALLDNIGKRIGDARPALSRVADQLRVSERELFEREGGGAWPALSPLTLASRKRRGQGTRILDATGELMASLTRKGAPGAVERITADEIVFGTDVPQAKYQGRRPPVRVGPQTAKRAADVLLEHFVAGDHA